MRGDTGTTTITRRGRRTGSIWKSTVATTMGRKCMETANCKDMGNVSSRSNPANNDARRASTGRKEKLRRSKKNSANSLDVRTNNGESTADLKGSAQKTGGTAKPRARMGRIGKMGASGSGTNYRTEGEKEYEQENQKQTST